MGAVRVKSALRERLFTHLMRLGPGYTEGEPYLGCYLPQMALSTLVPLLIAAYLLALGRTLPATEDIGPPHEAQQDAEEDGLRDGATRHAARPHDEPGGVDHTHTHLG